MEENQAVKPTSRILTRQMVMGHDPCPSQRNLFMERFPEQVEVTVELAVSQASDWDWYWAADELLSYDGYRQWQAIRQAANGQFTSPLEPYRELFDQAYDAAWVARDEVLRGDFSVPEVGAAQMTFEESLAIPWAALAAAKKIATDRYKRATAKAWAEIYIAEGEGS
jgi:hypothetical protein